MDKINFHFNGKTYVGELIVSVSEEPHFYWCFLENEELIAGLGDCVAFKQMDGAIVPVEPYPHHYEELIQSMKAAIDHFLQQQKTTYS